MADIIAHYGGGGRSMPDGEGGGGLVGNKIWKICADFVSALVFILIIVALVKLIGVVVSL